MNNPLPFPWSWVWRLLAVLGGFWLFIQTWQLWLLGFTALIVAAAMLPAARWGEARRIPRAVTVMGIYVGLVILFSLLGRFLVPVLADQSAQLLRRLPQGIQQAKAWLVGLDALRVHIPFELPTPKVEGLQGLGAALVQTTFTATAGAVGAVLGFLLIFFLAAYLVMDGERISRGLLAWVPPRRRGRILELAEPVLARIGGYVRGQLLVSLAVGIILSIGLTLLGVPSALLIGGLAAMLNIVPFLGSIVAAILGILMALNVSPTLALWTTLLFWAVNVLEGKVLVPVLLGRTTGLHPLGVLSALLVGSALAGLVGVIVAVPFLAGLNQLLHSLYVEPMNGGAEGVSGVQ